MDQETLGPKQLESELKAESKRDVDLDALIFVIEITGFLLQLFEELVSLNLGLGLALFQNKADSKIINKFIKQWPEFKDKFVEMNIEKRKPVFSDFYNLLISTSPNLITLIEERDHGIPDCCEDGYGLNFFNHDFQFSEKPFEFEKEMEVFLYLLSLLVGLNLSIFDGMEDCYYHKRKGGRELIEKLREQLVKQLPEIANLEVRYASMKIIFHAGKMIERLKQEGKRRSDKPAEIGGMCRKGMVSYQDVRDALYKIHTKGMSNHRLCKEVREYIIEKESRRGERAKKVYSVKQIGRILEGEFNK